MDELNPKRMSERLLPLNFAAIHTTTLTGFNCLLNVLASDEKYDTLALLREEAERVFKELSEGGKVTMAIGETFWAHRWGMLEDKYGKPWMVNFMKPFP